MLTVSTTGENEMTKTFRVQMLAFGEPGEVREVDVPVTQLEVCTDQPWGTLGCVFHYGQNDFQPKDHCSVSVGDVIELNDDKYAVLPVGFRKLTECEYDDLCCTDQLERRWHAVMQ